MAKRNIILTDSALDEAIRAWYGEELLKVSRQHRDKTFGCPSLSRFAEAVVYDPAKPKELIYNWTPEERAHLDSNCGYCNMFLTTIERVLRDEVVRPEGRMGNPYIGKDGKDYDSIEALEEANRQFHNRMFKGLW